MFVCSFKYVSNIAVLEASYLVKALETLSSKTFGKYVVEREDLNSYWISERSNKAVFFSLGISPTLLNTETTDEAFQTSGN